MPKIVLWYFLISALYSSTATHNSAIGILVMLGFEMAHTSANPERNLQCEKYSLAQWIVLPQNYVISPYLTTELSARKQDHCLCLPISKHETNLHDLSHTLAMSKNEKVFNSLETSVPTL